MPITNRFNLPEPIINAIKGDSYDPGHGDFSCTELIKSPKEATLKKRHRDEIFEDASDLLYSMEGQLMHLLLERAGSKTEGYLVEKRHYAKFGRWNVSAQYDCLLLEGGVLSDYKRTTTYAFKKNADGTMDMKKEWFRQLNIQAEILKRNNIADIKKLQIVGMLRDWQPTQADRDPLYPQNQIVIMEIPLVSSERTEKYILERCELHQAARDCAIDDQIPECTAEERWEDPTKYAVMKKGAKRALKLFETPTEAGEFIEKSSDADKLVIEERPSFARHCLGIGSKVYCPARNFCHHYKKLAAEFKNSQEDNAAEG